MTKKVKMETPGSRNPAIQTSGSGQIAVQITGSGDLAMTDELAQLAADYGMRLDLPPAELVRRVGEAINVAERIGVGAGVALIKARTDLSHGEFGKHLALHNISKQRASELMAIADLISKAEPENRKKLLGQPKTALIGLARADNEVLEAMIQSGKLDQRLTLAEYEAEVKKLQEQVNRLDATNSELKAKTERLELVGSRLVDHVTPLAVAHVRRDAVLLAAEAGQCIDGFTVLMEKLNAAPAAKGGMDFTRPVAVSMLSALESVRNALTGQINAVIRAYGLDASLPQGADLQMVVPGPEEKALIDAALSELMVKAQLKRAQREHEHYVEARQKSPSKGRMRKAPGSDQ